jgi:uncharacterized protein
VHQHIETTIIEREQDEEDSDKFSLQGDFVDVDEIISTDFILDIEERILCREDCKGLCEKCGADLNESPCACKPEVDPRFAILGTLFDND